MTTNTEKFRVVVEEAKAAHELKVRVVEARPKDDLRAQMAKDPTPHHSPEIQKLLDQPAITADEIAMMDPEDLAEAEKRGLVKKGKRTPIEIWLTRRNIGITCRIVNEDETVNELEIESLSMRGAQREVTGYFKSVGYEPAGRWETAYEDVRDGSEETFRRFR